jgi:hypothetical protein
MKIEISNYFDKLKREIAIAKTEKAINVILKLGINYTKKINESLYTKNIKRFTLKKLQGLRKQALNMSKKFK